MFAGRDSSGVRGIKLANGKKPDENATKEAASKAADATKDAATKAADATKDAANKAVDATKDAMKTDAPKK